MEVKTGTLVLGEYEVEAKLKANSLFQWVEAARSRDQQSVVLQILSANLGPGQLEPLTLFFDSLQGMSQKEIAVPEQVLSGVGYPLVLVYSRLEGEPLIDAIEGAPERATEWWREASDLLFALHNRKLVHGCVTPESFLVVDGRPHLTGFGYAPLLESGNGEAMRLGGDFIAPEVKADHTMTPAADVYAFAKTVACWRPGIVSTLWFQQATDPDASLRFRRMREAFDELEKELTTLPQRKPKGGNGGIVTKPHYTVEVIERPFDGGSVTGSGTYLERETVIIEAKPRAGWEFDRWSGDIQGNKNPYTVTLNRNLSVVAHFEFDKVPGVAEGSGRGKPVEHRWKRYLLPVASVVAALIAIVPILRPWAGLTAVGCGVAGFRKCSPDFSRQRLLFGSASAWGMAMFVWGALGVVPPPHIITNALPEGNAGSFYSCNLRASGGFKPYDWSLIGGDLPRGLALSNSGELSGKPEVRGESRVHVMAKDIIGSEAKQSLTIRVGYTPNPIAVQLADAAAKLLDEVERDLLKWKRFPPPVSDVPRIKGYLAQKSKVAADKAQQSLELDPGYIKGYVCRVQALRFMQEYGDAMKLAKQGLNKFPQDLDLQYEMKTLQTKTKTRSNSVSSVPKKPRATKAPGVKHPTASSQTAQTRTNKAWNVPGDKAKPWGVPGE